MQRTSDKVSNGHNQFYMIHHRSMDNLIYFNFSFTFLSFIPQSVNGITCRHLFHTCRNAIMAIKCLELLYVASLSF